MSWPLMIRRVHGHSMLPALTPGTLIWGLRWWQRPRVSDVIIFEYNGHEMVKRVARIENGKLFVTGDNPADSKDSREFGLIDMNVVRGRVIFPRTRNSSPSSM